MELVAVCSDGDAPLWKAWHKLNLLLVGAQGERVEHLHSKLAQVELLQLQLELFRRVGAEVGQQVSDEPKLVVEQLGKLRCMGAHLVGIGSL